MSARGDNASAGVESLSEFMRLQKQWVLCGVELKHSHGVLVRPNRSKKVLRKAKQSIG